MEIFLVRHGETGGNLARRHQSETTQLSFVGEKQVKEVAEMIKQYKPTHLVTSNLVRAIETARIIGEACDLVPETNHNFIELVRPNYLYGHHHRSIKSIWFYMQWYLGRGINANTGGESYKELRNRFTLAQEYLALLPSDARVVVVSHAVFINLFIAHLCNKRALTPINALLAFRKVLTMKNANITPILFDNEDDVEVCAWSVNS